MNKNTLKVISCSECRNEQTLAAFVSGHPSGWITSLSGWSSVLEKSFPQIKDISLEIVDHEDKTIHGFLPLYFLKSILFGNRLISSPFATRGSPLLQQLDSFDLFQPRLIELMKQTKARSIEIRVSPFEIDLQLPAPFSLAKTFKCHTLQLAGNTIDQLYKNLHRSFLRRYVTRAGQAGASVHFAKTAGDVSVFYSLYSKTRKRLFLPAMPLTFFTSLWETFSCTGNVVYIIAETGNRPVAAIMLMVFGDRVSAEALGWDDAFSKDHVAAYIYWEAIKFAHAAGYANFDFGRTDPDNKNLMEYKSRWGTIVSDLPVYVYPALPAKKNSGGKNGAIGLQLRKIVFGLPDPVYRLVSNFCYRHLG